MALPFGTTRSLRPAFAPARDVSLAVKPPYAFALDGWFPLSLRGPSRVPGIFAQMAVSLSPWPRQRGDRYAIRAGRNLPDKEFRYLRTVIVTAAVYRGFGSLLRQPKPANRSP